MGRDPELNPNTSVSPGLSAANFLLRVLPRGNTGDELVRASSETALRPRARRTHPDFVIAAIVLGPLSACKRQALLKTGSQRDPEPFRSPRPNSRERPPRYAEPLISNRAVHGEKLGVRVPLFGQHATTRISFGMQSHNELFFGQSGVKQFKQNTLLEVLLAARNGTAEERRARPFGAVAGRASVAAQLF